MFVTVHFALSSTEIASLRAEVAHPPVNVGISGHQSSTEVARIRTIAALLDALRHHLDPVAI
jgi:hypothetical protein